ncbi:thioredoxin domain-containing protein [Parasediminibacterium paludis]|uniref:Thioredoxin domain-containing protein n=1 Tax=Parasediminibacterium paludis TaxID=908966 RepID=A0ABV8PT54_9BACT
MLFKNLCLATIFSIAILSSCHSQSTTNVDVVNFEQAITKGNMQLLDVRTPAEYQSGHLSNALLADWNNEAEFKRRTAALDKSKPVYTYCLSGVRSAAATQWLRQQGFTAYHLTGGINAWKKAGRPVEQATAVTQITKADYEAMIPRDKTVLVDISAVWCPPCKVMAPIIDSLAQANSGKLVLVKIDGGNQTELCKILNVNAFPTLIIYKQGKLVWQKEGLVSAKEIDKQLQ